MVHSVLHKQKTTCTPQLQLVARVKLLGVQPTGCVWSVVKAHSREWHAAAQYLAPILERPGLWLRQAVEHLLPANCTAFLMCSYSQLVQCVQQARLLGQEQLQGCLQSLTSTAHKGVQQSVHHLWYI